MEFEKPEELEMVQTAVRQFVTEQLKPLERMLLGRAADLSDAVMYLPAEKERELISLARPVLCGIIRQCNAYRCKSHNNCNRKLHGRTSFTKG